MKVVLHKVNYIHEYGFANLDLSIPAEDGGAGSVVSIGVSLDIESIKSLNYQQLVDAALVEASKHHKWIDKALRPDPVAS